MKAVFADTSFYLALWNPADRLHVAASEWVRSSSAHIVITEFVLVELGNFLCRSKSRERFPLLVRYLHQDPQMTVIAATSKLSETGLALYESRPDKEWSLTDCTSFVMMKERQLRDALTSDHHFEQAGFKVSAQIAVSASVPVASKRAINVLAMRQADDVDDQDATLDLVIGAGYCANSRLPPLPAYSTCREGAADGGDRRGCSNGRELSQDPEG